MHTRFCSLALLLHCIIRINSVISDASSILSPTIKPTWRAAGVFCNNSRLERFSRGPATFPMRKFVYYPPSCNLCVLTQICLRGSASTSRLHLFPHPTWVCASAQIGLRSRTSLHSLLLFHTLLKVCMRLSHLQAKSSVGRCVYRSVLLLCLGC